VCASNYILVYISEHPICYFPLIFSLKNWQIKVFYEVDTSDKEGTYSFKKLACFAALNKLVEIEG